jgi:hypothetical protein
MLSTPATSKPGQAVTVTATVKPVAPGGGAPAGIVTFTFDPAGSVACTGGNAVTLTSGDKAVCKIAKGALVSTVTVRGSYPGSASYGSSSASVQHAVHG